MYQKKKEEDMYYSALRILFCVFLVMENKSDFGAQQAIF